MTYLVIHTNAKAEPVVNHRLKADGFEVFWPHYPEWVRKHRGKGKMLKLRSYYPRYLFVEEDPRVYDINNTVGVSTILYGDDGPYRLPDSALSDLMSICDQDGLLYEEYHPTPEQRRRLEAGEEVVIKEGPLAGFEAMVKVDKGRTVVLEVKAFRGLVPAELRPDHVRTRRSVAR